MQGHERDSSPSSVHQPIPVHEVEVYQTSLSPTFAHDLQAAVDVVRGSTTPPKDYTGHVRMSKIPSAAAAAPISLRRMIWIVVFSPTGTRELLLFLGLLNPSTGRVPQQQPCSSSSLSATEMSGVVILLPIRRDCHGTEEEEEVVKAECEREGSGGDGGDEAGRGRRGEGGEEVEVLIAAIGPTSRDHLIDTYSFQPHVTALDPTPHGVGDAIRRFLIDRSTLQPVREQ